MNFQRRSLLLSFFLISLLFTTLASPAAAQERSCLPPLPLAQRILDGILDWGEIPLEGGFALDEAFLDRGRLLATITVEMDLQALRAEGSDRIRSLCAAVIADVDGELEILDDRTFATPELSQSGTEGWRYNVRLDLNEATSQLLLLIQNPITGSWGSVALVESLDRPIPPSQNAVRLATQGTTTAWYEVAGGNPETQIQTSPPQTAPPRTTAPPTTAPPTTSTAPPRTTPQPNPGTPPRTSPTTAPPRTAPAPATPPTARIEAPNKPRGAQPTVLRLVPPRNQPATGTTRFDALTSTDMVREVIFKVDGEEVSRRRRRPFVGRLDLAKPARAQEVTAIALDVDGRELGSDTIVVNEMDFPFRVRIADWRPSDDGITVEANVSVPQGARLTKVELYLNELLVETYQRAPFRGVVPVIDPGPEEYIRVAAYLADGSSIDDVVLLGSPGPIEEVEVNLVELHMVVTDADGRPVDDLKPDEVTILHRGKERQIDTFSYADDVPLVLGLVIDTSGSMRLMMEDTKRAAARFLGQTITEKDRAFVVDFDKQPRLIQPTTQDMVRLLTSMAQLVPEGETAMYDAVVFSMLQFEREAGRKALVVLTDGDDRDSRYGPKHSIDYAQKAGVPVYVIGLSGLDGFQRVLPKKDLRKMTLDTGGRLYFVGSHEHLALAYAEINAELRSQYSLTFYTESDLTEEERREVEVKIKRRGLEARTVVGTGSSTY